MSILLPACSLVRSVGPAHGIRHRRLAAFGKSASHIVEVKPGRLGQRIHGAPVIPPDDVQPLRGRPLVVSVAREGPRTQIRSALARMGFREGQDYVCAA